MTWLLLLTGCMDTLLPALPFETASNQVNLGHVDLSTSTAFRSFEVLYDMEPDLANTYERAQLEIDYETINTSPYEALVTLWILDPDWDGGLVPSDALMGSVIEIPPTEGTAEPEHIAERLFIAAGPPAEHMNVVLTMEGSAELEGTGAVRVRAWYPDALDDPWLQVDVLGVD